jgi:nucleoside-diphosphate-sugar epimerase
MRLHRILVTGSTGFLGRRLVPALTDCGYEVRCLIRKDGSSGNGPHPTVSYAVGDVTDKESLVRALEGIDAVVNLAAVVRSSDRDLYYRVNRDGVVNLIQSCVDADVGRIIHMSTQDVVFDTGDYSKSKLLGEKAIESSSTRFTILRPTAIYGEDYEKGTGLGSLIRMVKNLPFVPMIGDGRSKIQPVYIGDVVKSITASLANDNTIGKSYFIGGPDEVTYEQLVDIIMEAAGLRKIKLFVPGPMLLFGARLLESVMDSPPITRDAIRLLMMDKTCPIVEMKRDLVPDPVGLEDGMSKIL